MRFGIKYALYPTPDKIKRIVDAIKGGLGASGLAALLVDYPKFAIALGLATFILDAVSNFFAHDDKNCELNPYDVK